VRRSLTLLGVFFFLLAVAFPVPCEAQGRKPPAIVREAQFSGKTYLSLDDVTLAIQGRMSEHPMARGADLVYKSHTLQFVVGASSAVVDGEAVSLDAAPVRDSRSLWVPRSFFASGPLAEEFHEQIDLGPLPVKKPVSKVEKPKVETVEKPLNAPTTKETVVEEKEEVVAPPIPHAIRRVVIDPGHGGKDPGTVGGHGTEEKTVNLWMGQELADSLREKDFEVILTRTDDTFIPLRERAALANRYKADLFISLHCNASLSTQLSGFEVYILSEKASDPHAAAVAKLENASLDLEGKAPSAPVQAVLRSLVKNANINHAAQLGSIMDREVSKQLDQSNAGLQQAAFYVLRGAEMPAVLVEMGFLSNKREATLLESKSYRQKMIQAIEASIVEYDKKQQDQRR
jgi:N-acetylmuramoyl-L-alanine amidase